jgi:hypothetical protein
MIGKPNTVIRRSLLKRGFFLFLSLLTTILSLPIIPLHAQQQDFTGIIELHLQKKISKSFSISLFNEEIFNQNLAELGIAFVDLGIDYKLNRHFSVGANYRLIKHKNPDNFYDTRQMILADVTYTRGIGKFSFSGRVKFQNQYYPEFFWR